MRKWKKGILLLYGILPRNPLFISSTCPAFRGYFSEISHALYQASVPSTKRKWDVRAYHFSRVFERELTNHKRCNSWQVVTQAFVAKPWIG